MSVPLMLPVARRGRGHTPLSGKLGLFTQSPPAMSEVSSVAASIRALRPNHFDYYHLRSANAWQNIISPSNVINQATLQSEVDTFEGSDFDDMRFIFQMQTGGEGGLNFSTNGDWTNSASNMAKIGTVIGSSPLFDAIYWDWEYYGGSTYWFNESTAAGLSGTVDQKSDQVKDRFEELMNGLLSTWPTARLITSHGPSGGMGSAYDWIGEGGWNISHNDVSGVNRFMASAFTGMMRAVDAAGHKAILFDGGQQYGIRTEADTNRVREMQQIIVPRNPDPGGSDTYTPTLMSDMTGKYRVGVCQGVYDRSDYPNGTAPEGPEYDQFETLPASSLTQMITSAMHQTHYTWLYCETWQFTDINWLTDATTEVRDAVAEGLRLGRL